LALIVGLALTPPGQAAISWAAGLVGIGDVGGPPTSDERPAMVTPASEQVVIGKGQSPGGSPYEIVAYRTDDPVAGESDVGATCVFVDFLQGDGQNGGACGDHLFRSGHALYFEGMSGHAGKRDVPETPYAMGYVTPEVDHVTVQVGDSDSPPETAQLVELNADYAQRLSSDVQFGYFLAFLPKGFQVSPSVDELPQQVTVRAFDRTGAEIDSETFPSDEELRDTRQRIEDMEQIQTGGTVTQSDLIPWKDCPDAVRAFRERGWPMPKGGGFIKRCPSTQELNVFHGARHPDAR
jgi:hypothetical protein